MNKYKVGEVVLYQNGTSFELGVVKEVVSLGSQQEGKIAWGYRVWYHTGDTSAMTDESNLHKIINTYAFHIDRIKVDDLKENRVLLIDGKEVLTINLKATDITVSGDEGEEDFVPIGEYLETTLDSNMMFDGVNNRCSWKWEDK